MVGRTISHYRIEEKVGQGGMGVVYRAVDTRLDRTVALKFLPPHLVSDDEAKARFLQEAGAASILDHPNITVVYELGEAEDLIFIAMGFVEGKSIKELITSGELSGWTMIEIIDATVQIADGLFQTHQRGIVHRDIKSENVMVTDDGLVKITDFGLAKLLGRPGASEAGTRAGTVYYMSPEQTQGSEIDHRSDIFSLGVVLYEMITGKLPFRGDYEAAVVYSILNETPEPLAGGRADVPPEMEKIVARALAKAPELRYQGMEELRADLTRLRREISSSVDRLAGDRGDSQPSIAVLPFANLSADKEQDFFCDGIAEEIINALTQMEGLKVVARTSSFQFRGREIDIREIGRRLNVETILEGSVRSAGKRLRITAQLISVSDGYHLWSQRFDREMEDVFVIQDEITLSVVDKLRVKLLGDKRAALVKRRTVNAEAYGLYLRGRFFWNKRTEEGYRKALDYFDQAIESDPTYAAAYVGKADCYDLLGWYDHLPPEVAFPAAKAAAEKALEMDETLAEAHASLGWINVNYGWEWTLAEKEYRRAIELNPSYASAHQWLAEFLSYMGRHEEAVVEAEIARELDPLSLIINTDLGQVYYYAGQYESAARHLTRTLEMDDHFALGHLFLGWCYVEMARPDQALNEARATLRLAGSGNALALAQLGVVCAATGRQEDARRVLLELEELSGRSYVSPFYRGLIHAGLGESDQAFAWLEEAYEKRDHWLETLKVHPRLEAIRSDHRFTTLLTRMGLA